MWNNGSNIEGSQNDSAIKTGFCVRCRSEDIKTGMGALTDCIATI